MNILYYDDIFKVYEDFLINYKRYGFTGMESLEKTAKRFNISKKLANRAIQFARLRQRKEL